MALENLNNVLNNLSENVDKKILTEMLKSMEVLKNDTKGIEEIKKAQKIINSLFPIDNDRPFLFSTQNQRYIEKVIPENLENAFVITGPGDSILELINLGVKNIVSTDINKFQTLIFKLRRAALLTLSAKDFRKFMLDFTSKDFLSLDIFKTVKIGLGEDEEAINFWEAILINDKKDLLTYFFRTVSNCDISLIEYGMPYLKNRKSFYEVRNKLEHTNITLINEDAINFLSNCNNIFDYIDISNILIFIYQLKCNNDFDEYYKILKQLRVIYDEKLSNGGSMVLDYMFSITEKTLQNPNADIPELGQKIYLSTLNILKDMFSLEIITIDKINWSVRNEPDTILLTKKR